MSDERERALERRARQGDCEAGRALRAALARRGVSAIYPGEVVWSPLDGDDRYDAFVSVGVQYATDVAWIDAGDPSAIEAVVWTPEAYDEWDEVLNTVDAVVRQSWPHLVPRWEEALARGRGPDADRDADGLRRVWLP